MLVDRFACEPHGTEIISVVIGHVINQSLDCMCEGSVSAVWLVGESNVCKYDFVAGAMSENFPIKLFLIVPL